MIGFIFQVQDRAAEICVVPQVRTRASTEQDKTLKQMADIEADFFVKHPRPAGIKPVAGLQAFCKLLVSIQATLLCEKMPDFVAKVPQQLPCKPALIYA